MFNYPICPALLICSLVCLTASVHAAAPTQSPPLGLPVDAAVRKDARTTLLVPLPVGPAWQDMAFLAAIPAMVVANNGAPSLIVLDAAGKITPEVQDYLRRYRPDEVIFLGDTANAPVIAGRTCALLKADSLDAAACALSMKYWRTSSSVVISPEGDYEAALVAAPLAARLRVPLFFTSEKGLSPLAVDELRRLKTRELIAVGKIVGGPQSFEKVTNQVTELITAHDVMTWTRERGLTVTYLTVLNPLDREKTVIKKLSLAGALLSAGRDGLVVPLPYEVRWKQPFNAVEMSGKLPKSGAQTKSGRISSGEREHAFVLTGNSKDRNLKIFIDVDADGKSTGPGEGPFATGDTVELCGKRFAITLGTENGVGKADVRLTWPTTEQIVGDLRNYYATLGAAPEYLCLVGFPDAIPQAIIGEGAVIEEQTSDLPYANADADSFAEVCVSRVIGENASFATLYASRVLTYSSLLGPEWQGRTCQASWENTYGEQFENVGFDAG